MVRYVHLPAAAVDTTLLEDATRRGMSPLPHPQADRMLIRTNRGSTSIGEGEARMNIHEHGAIG